MSNIKDYPLNKLGDFLEYAYEKELYTRWLTIYPFMELGFVDFISFKKYKEKALEQVKVNKKNENLTNNQIVQHGLEIVKRYEQNRQKAGEKIDGNI